MNRAFIFPNRNQGDPDRPNPYLFNFAKSLQNTFRFINLEEKPSRGVFDIFPILWKIDYIFLNWVENIPDRRFGALQTAALVVAVQLLKLRRAVVVFTLHNKSSHVQSRVLMKRYLLGFTLRHATMILTHAEEGREFLSSNYPEIRAPVKVIPHPTDPNLGPVERAANPEFDLLLWGALLPYKGIKSFLEAVPRHEGLRKLRIKIVGKAQSVEYFESLKCLATDGVDLENRFPNLAEIRDLTRRSRATLFTYQEKSVLSSGALMDALSLGAFVIGPRIGAFLDLEASGVIATYGSYDGIPEVLARWRQFDPSFVSEWVRLNSWERFGAVFSDWIRTVRAAIC